MRKEEYLELLEEGTKIHEQCPKEGFLERGDGWLVNRQYNNPEEAVDDINYLTSEYKNKGLDETQLDAYFYKRRWIQDRLNEFYADEYVLVDKFNKPQKVFKYYPGAEEVITELASDMDCYVVLKKGDKYFMELGDDIIDLGLTPTISEL